MARNWQLAMRQNALRLRADILYQVRAFFTGRGYLEVETSHRIPSPAPESHIDAIPSGNWFLHPSPELCMKRLLAAGYDRIFQICRCWREGERGTRHLPEFTLLEWYRSESDYRALMEECEDLILNVADGVGRGQKLIYQGRQIDLARPWERISVREAFERYTPISMTEALEQNLFDDLMVEQIEPRLGAGKPTFIQDYPAERGALARLKQDDPTVAERFELYISGLELANAFSELTDPQEQRKRFQLEEAFRRTMSKPVYPMPDKFLSELEGMQPSAGAALGVDRLVMIFLDALTIDEVVTFTPEEL